MAKNIVLAVCVVFLAMSAGLVEAGIQRKGANEILHQQREARHNAIMGKKSDDASTQQDKPENKNEDKKEDKKEDCTALTGEKKKACEKVAAVDKKTGNNKHQDKQKPADCRKLTGEKKKACEKSAAAQGE